MELPRSANKVLLPISLFFWLTNRLSSKCDNYRTNFLRKLWPVLQSKWLLLIERKISGKLRSDFWNLKLEKNLKMTFDLTLREKESFYIHFSLLLNSTVLLNDFCDVWTWVMSGRLRKFNPKSPNIIWPRVSTQKKNFRTFYDWVIFKWPYGLANIVAKYLGQNFA